MSANRVFVAAISGVLLVAACKSGGDANDAGAVDAGTGDGGADTGATLTRAKLLDPLTCKGCHPNQYQEWASSMHAYATDDPVFVAMNARGQREAQLGKFCVNCHAPLAVREGYATDGKNLGEIPDHLKGVTCYFCHNVESVAGTHNNPLTLANDTTMRGGLDKPLRPSAHGVRYSALVDGTKLAESSKLCGSCHDIESGHGVELERTYAEWQSSIYSKPTGSQSCGDCHMEGYRGIAADVRGLPLQTRRVHRHMFAGVDLALTPFHDDAAQRVAAECKLRDAARVSICPNPDASFEVLLETNAGHRFPSGASQDRRAWLEFIAYDDQDKVIFQSGVVPEGEVVEKPKGAAGHDSNLWVLRDRIFDAKGNEALMFWDAEKSSAHPEGYESSALPETLQAGTPHTVSRTYRLTKMPARVRVQVHVQPIGREVLDSLVASKDLDATLATKMPTLTLNGTISEWKASAGFSQCVTSAQPDTLTCPDDYLCLLYPTLPQCQTK